MASALADFVPPARVATLAAPIAVAEGLPGVAYGAAFFELEQRELFPRAWCAVTTGARLPNPGDRLPIDLAGWPLLAVRGRDGKMRVFHNICRHRGMKLAGAKKCAPTIVCPWHGWAYDLDGNLKATPQLGGEGVREADGFDRAALGLLEVRSAGFLDYVLVNIDGQAPPIETHLQPLQDLLAGLDFCGMAHFASATHTYAGNWKIAIEGGIEDYHLPHGHPQLMRNVAARETKVFTGGTCFSGTSGKPVPAAGRVTEWAEATAALPRWPLAPPADPGRGYILNLFPVGILAVEPDHLMLGLFTPDGAAATRIEFDTYFPAAALADPSLAETLRWTHENWGFVAGQDADFVRGVQECAPLRDQAGIGTRFSPYWEGAVRHFQRLVVATFSGAAL